MGEIVNIFNFLKEFNELSNPVISEIRNQKWSLNISDIPEIDEIQSIFHGHDLDEMVYLEVKRPLFAPCPSPPDMLFEWITNDWKKVSLENVDVAEKLSRKTINENGELTYTDELFTDDPERIEAYTHWLAKRKKWHELEFPKVKGLELYNRLFQLYSEIKLESESVELILGDGIIRWYTGERVIDHPVLLQKVFLQFDAHVPLFRVYCEEKSSELYTPMLRVISSINQKMLSDIINEVENGDYDLATTGNTEGLYRRLINIIDNKGEYSEHSGPINEKASIHSAPVLFLRKRTLGFSSFIENVIDDVQANSEIALPDFFHVMSGVYNEELREEIVEKSWNQNGIDEDVLLTLPANNEQLRIIKHLERYGAVLVQGPPGTGKTHTIANLIGHLLSQGNSVLVTSHTEKALTVLKDKVYKDPLDPEVNLQNLCISVLSSTSQKKEMDEAINEIASKSSSLDLHTALSRISRLTAERKKLVDNTKSMTTELTRARSMEYKDLIFDNHSIPPIEAARFLLSGENKFDYITGKSSNSEIGFPLTYEEQVALYASNVSLSCEEEALLHNQYPANEEIMSSPDFESLVEQILTLRKKLAERPWINSIDINVSIAMVKQLLEESNRLLSFISGFDSMEKALVNQTIVDPVYPKLWDNVLERIEVILARYEFYRKLKLNLDFDIDASVINPTALQAVQAMVDSGKEKPVGIFSSKDWKIIRDAIKLNGKVVELRSDFINARELISYEVEKQEVIKLFQKLLAEIMEIEDFPLDDFENRLRRYKEQIVSALNWYKQSCSPHFKEIEEHVQWNSEKRYQKLTSIDSLDAVLSNLQISCELFQSKIDAVELVERIKVTENYKKLLSGYSDANPYIAALLVCVQNLDSVTYPDRLIELKGLINKAEIADKRNQLLSRIREIAPALATQIENREGIHAHSSVPDTLENAWKHFQLRNQIEELDTLDPAKIQSEIEQSNKHLLRNARMLALEKAWYEKIKNQTDRQNQALQGWRNTVKQIGKGTGKNAPKLKAKARELMPLCQTAIPVWIMPLSRVVENFDPRNNKFDVIIVDEASQANILSLATLYLAKKVIIVGDDEQVSPDVVGIKSAEVDALIAQHLERIPNNHLYNGLTSLYDMAKSSGVKPIMLAEHFRCLPEIIDFSNDLSYNGRIKPLRDSSNTPIYPPVVEYRVPDGYRNNNKVNETEIEHIVSLIQAFLEMDEYKGQTIGVISMLGNEQSSGIEKKLQAVIDPVEYESRRIQCGTPPQFQGDERDIIILSLVDSPNDNGGPLRLLSADGRNDLYRKRYNVAVSRARNQLWVVHSLNPDIDLKPDDLRLKLIKYAINPNRDQDHLISMSESPFETEVMEYLLREKYKIIPQYKVGAYRIDMVVQSGDKKVALECDGERFHTAENLENDLARQAILERLGWRFIRIRGSVYYRNPNQTMKNVLKTLENYGIVPSFEENTSNQRTNNALINIVKIKASSYRNDIEKVVTEEKSGVFENYETLQLDIDGKSDLEVNPEIVKAKQTKIEFNKPNTKKKDNSVISDTARQEDGVPVKEVYTQQPISDDENQQKRNNKDSQYAFDFRKKQNQDTQQVKGTPRETETSLPEKTEISKPKFDFRKNKL